MKKIIKNVILVLITLIILFSFKIQLRAAEEQTVKAEIIVIYGTEEIKEKEELKKIQKVSVKILEGNYESEEYDAEFYINSNNPYELKKGNNVYVKINQEEGEITNVTVEKIIRQNYINYFVIMLLIISIFVFGKKGLKILISLIIEVLIMWFLIINYIYSGTNSFVIGIISSVIIILINTVIINGINRKSLIIMLSSCIGIAISGFVAIALGKIAMLSNNLQNSISIEINSNINYQELILTSSVIVSIGLCLDITNYIVEKLRNITEKINFRNIIKELSNQIVNKYNILIFICLGILLTYITTINNLQDILNNEIIVTIIVIIISVLISLISLVPITILIYMWLNKNTRIYKTQSDNVIDGQRTLKL